ncbi:hypothetical protein [Erythrobacter crassostreae]|uniref:Uncharacterized protein n=1 Tax=Erythrobacter crassostreae TaxID=2828328 RepID=A0A9X1JLM6_9SPHN|nr:hypothetical protein [Erythrobacter crassostrea]MBV7260320.1 hypothetical protein [Erythrobacter crassostrea]
MDYTVLEIHRAGDWLKYRNIKKIDSEAKLDEFLADPVGNIQTLEDSENFSRDSEPPSGERALDIVSGSKELHTYIFLIADTAFKHENVLHSHDHGVKFASPVAFGIAPSGESIGRDFGSVIVEQQVWEGGRLAKVVIDADRIQSSPAACALKELKFDSIAIPFCLNLVAKFESDTALPVVMVSGSHSGRHLSDHSDHEHLDRDHSHEFAHRGPHLAAASYFVQDLG